MRLLQCWCCAAWSTHLEFILDILSIIHEFPSLLKFYSEVSLSVLRSKQRGEGQSVTASLSCPYTGQRHRSTLCSLSCLVWEVMGLFGLLNGINLKALMIWKWSLGFIKLILRFSWASVSLSLSPTPVLWAPNSSSGQESLLCTFPSGTSSSPLWKREKFALSFWSHNFSNQKICPLHKLKKPLLVSVAAGCLHRTASDKSP